MIFIKNQNATATALIFYVAAVCNHVINSVWYFTALTNFTDNAKWRCNCVHPVSSLSP